MFLRFNHFLNLLGYNPNGKEGPDKAARQEGYLFWLAWLNHSATAAVLELRRQRRVPPGHDRGAVRDARAGRCKAQPSLEFTSVLTPLLTDSKACNGGQRRQRPQLPPSRAPVTKKLKAHRN